MNSQILRNTLSSFLDAILIEDIDPIVVGPGCSRRDLPGTSNVRVWVVDMEPNSEWPRIDEHDQHGEEVYIVSGELIEGENRFTAGTYLFFKPGSSHKPRTEKGVRLFGFNLTDNG